MIIYKWLNTDSAKALILRIPDLENKSDITNLDFLAANVNNCNHITEHYG